MLTQQRQLDLFDSVIHAYASAPDGVMDNDALYAVVADSAGIDADQLNARVPIGKAKAMRSPVKQRVRWHQQALKKMGILQKVPGQRGTWRLSEIDKKGLERALPGVKLVAFSTDLGVAIWGRCQSVFPSFVDQIALAITSPPYPLRQARAYGNPSDAEYVDFICKALEPVIRSLMPGGSLVLNLGQDIFEPGLPSRSMYLERLSLALHDRLGLSLMDRIPWVNYSKPPAPTIWACRTNVKQPRVQLVSAWEAVLWFTNDPSKVRSDNRRVLEKHTEEHQKLMRAGGENRTAIYGDGAYRLEPGSFGNHTEGRIPRNVFERGHVCADTMAYRRYAKDQGLPVHGAMFPTALPKFFIELLTEPEEMVVDCFGGSIKTGLAAEQTGRRWLATEWIRQYLQGAVGLFQGFSGFQRGVC